MNPTKIFLLLALLVASLMSQTQTTVSRLKSEDSNLKFQISNLASPHIVITKSKRKLDLFDGKKLIRSYKMVLGSTPLGDKEIEGDGRTPEGEFYVFTKNAESRFYLSLGISYPAPDDAKRGLARKLINDEEADAIKQANLDVTMPPQKTALGGEIYIHGGGTESDWTDGCVALKDEEIKQLFDAVTIGTRVTIKP